MKQVSLAQASIIKKIENLTLTSSEIIEIIDAADATDEIVDFIANKYRRAIENDESLSHARDVIELVDLTKHDEESINFSEAAKRSFCSLMAFGRLTRPEIIFFIKKNIATDSEIQIVMSKFPSKDLVEIVLRWRPYLFETVLCKYCAQYSISNTMIDNMKRRHQNIEKFKFISQ